MAEDETPIGPSTPMSLSFVLEDESAASSTLDESTLSLQDLAGQALELSQTNIVIGSIKDEDVTYDLQQSSSRLLYHALGRSVSYRGFSWPTIESPISSHHQQRRTQKAPKVTSPPQDYLSLAKKLENSVERRRSATF